MPGFKIKKQEGYDLSTAEKETLEAITVLGDPGADRILFWDDSANTWKFLTIGSGLNITDTTITATSSGDVIGPASATDNAIVRFNLTTGKLIQNSNVTIDDNGAIQMPNNQWFSFKDYAGTGSINAFKGTIDDEIDVAAQLNVGTIEAEEDAGAIPLFDMPVSSSSVDGTEMSATIRIDGNNILKVYAEADGAGGADSFAVKLLSGAGLDITEIAATSDTDKFLVSDSNRVKYRTGSEVLSDIGGQASLGFTPENVANKKTTITDSDTDYPTGKAVKTVVDAKESVANKKTDLTDNSDIYYPSQKAVKTAVDAKAPSASPTLTGTVTLPKAVNIKDTSADHEYQLGVSELAANRTVTLPLLTGNDTFMFKDFHKASSAEINTGTEDNKYITPDGLAGSNIGTRMIQVKVCDDATALTTGDGKIIFMIPEEMNGMNLVKAHAMVSTVSSSGTPTIQIRNVTDSADMLSTKITIDASEYTSYTAATAPVIDTSKDDVATGDRIAIDVDSAGSGAKGLTIFLAFRLP